MIGTQMSLIPPTQWRPLFDAVYEMNTATDHADFLSAVVKGMSRLVSADLCLVHVLDRKTQKIVIRTIPENPYTEEEVAFYAANPNGDPLVAYFDRTKDPKARRSVVGNPGEYLYWDSAHGTAAVNTLIAEAAYQAVVPEPSTWALLLGSIIAALFFARKRPYHQ